MVGFEHSLKEGRASVCGEFMNHWQQTATILLNLYLTRQVS
jgi:hypothetical protein